MQDVPPGNHDGGEADFAEEQELVVAEEDVFTPERADLAPLDENNGVVDENGGADGVINENDTAEVVASEEGPPCLDVDGDGYLPPGCSAEFPPDCEEGNPTVHPGALELCGNGKDEDCFEGDLSCDAALSPLTDSISGSVTSIGNGNFVIGFDPANGGVPTELFLPNGGNANLIAQDPRKNEKFAAISHYDNWYSWRPDAPVSIELLTAGTATYQIRLAWSAGGPPTSALQGESLYTIYPDGRVHRRERVQVNTEQFGYFLAYLSVDSDQWDTFQYDVGGGTQTYFKTGNYWFCLQEGDQSDRGWGCALNSVTADTAGWSHYQAGSTFPKGFRFCEATGWADHVLISSEWVRSENVPVGSYHGEVMMLFGADGNCDRVRDQSTAFHTPPEIATSSGAPVTTSDGDDDTDGYNEGLGAYVLSAANGHSLEFSTGIATLPSLAIRIAEMALGFDPVVSINGQQVSHGQAYLLQADPDPSAGWIFFRGPMAPGTDIRLISP